MAKMFTYVHEGEYSDALYRCSYAVARKGGRPKIPLSDLNRSGARTIPNAIATTSHFNGRVVKSWPQVSARSENCCHGNFGMERVQQVMIFVNREAPMILLFTKPDP